MLENIKNLTDKLKGKGPEKLLQYFAENYKEEIVFSTSLGAEDQVITDMIARNDLNIEIFTLDTGRLPYETYEILNRTERTYGIKIRVYFPDRKKIEKMVNRFGIDLFYDNPENRKMCCRVRKVEQLKRALLGKKVWITGLRREQSVTREGLGFIDYDEGYGVMKLNPLIDWSSEMVWKYIKENKVPYNRLHDEGYLSIGCAPCTRAVKEGEDIRAGRWWWESPERRECGLHIKKR